jgi:AcrR family transcriptional regulator
VAQPGRPSLAAQRREQILDGVVACILRYGLDGTTRSRIAHQAGVSPSAVHHFVGTQDEVMAAAVARALGRVTSITVDAFAELPVTQRLDAQLNVLFTDSLAAPQVTQLVDELVAQSYRDPATRAAVSALYLRFQQLLTESVDAAYPHAPQPTREMVAHALLALAHATATFHALGFDPQHATKARRAADHLLQSLTDQHAVTRHGDEAG